MSDTESLEAQVAVLKAQLVAVEECARLAARAEIARTSWWPWRRNAQTLHRIEALLLEEVAALRHDIVRAYEALAKEVNRA